MVDSWPGLLDHVGTIPVESRTTADQAGFDALIGYFVTSADRLGHYGWLRTGRSIGSGGVESLTRRMGRRPKVPGRGWCVDRLKGMASLIATVDAPETGEPFDSDRRFISRSESYTPLLFFSVFILVATFVIP